MALPRLSAVTAGGGIGGLAAALALARQDIDVRVCERRSEWPEEGAGVQIGPNGTRILQDIGVARYLEGKVASPDALIVHNAISGRELARFPLGDWIAKRHGAPYWTAHRRDLHLALRQAAEQDPRISLTPSNEIVSFQNEATGVATLGAKGEVQSASFLIAADGLWSTLRSGISGAAPNLRPFGKSAFRGVTGANNMPPALAANAVHIWLSPGAHAVHYPVNGGRDIGLVVIARNSATAEGWDAPAVAETVQSKIENFAQAFRELAGSAPFWRQWSLYTMPPLPRWTNDRAVLLGDAAHPMLPFLAQGAVMALEDAVTLAAHISASKGDIESALHGYERARRPRVARVQGASDRNGRIYHMSGAAAFARNTVMRARSPESVMADFDWLYGWKLTPC